MKDSQTASLIVGLWAAVLTLLGLAWVNTPPVGPLATLLVWTVAAAALAVWSWGWLRRRTSLLPGYPTAAGAALVWAFLLWTLWRELGRSIALDGLILRQPLRRGAGLVLVWSPFACALLFALGMLALALEARYRLAHPEKYPGGSGSRGGRRKREKARSD